MKRESLITNTEKLLFDILETMKKIEENTNPLSFIKDAVMDKPIDIVDKSDEKYFDLENLRVTCDTNHSSYDVSVDSDFKDSKKDSGEKTNGKMNVKRIENNKKTNVKKGAKK